MKHISLSLEQVNQIKRFVKIIFCGLNFLENHGEVGAFELRVIDEND
jgi:hypothetical protein